MLKVKMFWINDYLTTAEEEINNWLRDNSHVKIERILQSADGEASGTTAVISIWYSEVSESELKDSLSRPHLSQSMIETILEGLVQS